MLERLARRVSPRIVEAAGALDAVAARARRVLQRARGASSSSTLDWALIGPFASRVLRADRARSPTAACSAIGDVAAEAGSPRGSRAAGNALGSNPIPIVIPCHRVLRSGGALGGYGGGLDRKRWLLELEGAL